MSLLERSFYNGIRYHFVSFVHFAILAFANYGTSLSVVMPLSQEADNFFRKCW